MRMKKFAKLAMTATAGLLLAACGNGGNGATDSGDGQTTIRFMTGELEEDRLQTIEELIADFEEQNEDVTVELLPVEESEYNTNIITYAQAGEMPEVIQTGNAYLKNLESEQLIDQEAINSLVEELGTDDYFEGVLDLVASEDGSQYLGAPLTGWIQGIWYRPSVFEAAGIEEPTNWEEIRNAAEQLHNSEHADYGIVLPTAAEEYAEQSFSQFALSNDANLLNVSGDEVTSNMSSPEMREAVEYYQSLYDYSVTGSNDATVARDSFANGSAGMILYSTYILPTVFEAGDSDDIDFIIPEEEEEAVFGSVSSLTISAGQDEERLDASKRFIEFLREPENNVRWVLMAPGGGQPVSEEIAQMDEYQNNEVVESFGDLSLEIAESFSSVQIFGVTEDGRNLSVMGDITAANVIGTLVNDITVQGVDIDQAIESAESEIQSILQE